MLWRSCVSIVTWLPVSRSVPRIVSHRDILLAGYEKRWHPCQTGITINLKGNLKRCEERPFGLYEIKKEDQFIVFGNPVKLFKKQACHNRDVTKAYLTIQESCGDLFEK